MPAPRHPKKKIHVHITYHSGLSTLTKYVILRPWVYISFIIIQILMHYFESPIFALSDEAAKLGKAFWDASGRMVNFIRPFEKLDCRSDSSLPVTQKRP